MPRGITQDQVNTAADTLLAAGENPTVEKVRGALGTGSPNTVTRMLDAWRMGLGERLRQLQALPDIPSAVGQAMTELWRLAVTLADEQLQASVAEERATLAAAQADLAAERTRWTAALAEAETAVAQANAARDLAEHVCTTLDGQLQDSHALRDDLVQQRERLQALTDQQRHELEALRAERATLEQVTRQEREQLAAQLRQAEDRAHQEVDRARQEAKSLQGRLDAQVRDHGKAITTATARQATLQASLHEAERQVAHHAGRAAALEQALTQAAARSASVVPRKAKPRPSPSTKRRKTAVRPGRPER
jgi:chromosome segregation ATPase